MYHDNEPDHQEGAVVDKQRLHDAPQVGAAIGPEGVSLDALISCLAGHWPHHCSKKNALKIMHCAKLEVAANSTNTRLLLPTRET